MVDFRDRTRGGSSDRGSDRGARDSERGSSRDRGSDRGSERSSRGRGGDDRRRFSYTQRNADDTRQRAESGGGDTFDKFVDERVKFFKPHDKANAIRILPPTWDGAKHYGLDVWVHYGVGPDRQTYLCPNKMKGERCPLCEEHAKAQRAGDEDYAKELRPTRRVLVYLIDRDNEKEGVMAWAMPQSLDTAILQISIDRRTGDVLSIDHPDEGYDITFSKEGSKDRTKYTGAAIDRRDSPLGDDAWLDYAVDNPLPDMLRFFSYEHIQNVFGGGGELPDTTREARSDAGADAMREQGRGRERARVAEPEPASRGAGSDGVTWQEVQELNGEELDSLVELQELDIDPQSFDSDDELRAAICQALDLHEPAPQRGGSHRERLRAMRS